jgi:hypothetical protein
MPGHALNKPAPMRTTLLIPTLLASAMAADTVPSRWTESLRLGLNLTNTAVNGAEDSRDPTIGGTTRSTNWMFTLDAGLLWKGDVDEVEQAIKARYGRQKQAGDSWKENLDEARYDGVLRHTMAKPHFVYLSWGAETVFTGPAPEKRKFDPILAKVAGGYGQKHENVLVDGVDEVDSAEGRIGARAQRKFGSVTSDDREIAVGIEGFARYAIAVKKDLTAFAQYEAFAPLKDLKNVQSLVTAGLSASVAKFVGGIDLRVDLGFRAYHEAPPKDREEGDGGYGAWSMRQDTLVGLTWTY